MELGANLDVDVSYQWLRFFLEDDDELARIGLEYGTESGEFWSTGSVKAKLVQVLKELVKEHLRHHVIDHQTPRRRTILGWCSKEAI
jgi:hypothetical protein